MKIKNIVFRVFIIVLFSFGCLNAQDFDIDDFESRSITLSQNRSITYAVVINQTTYNIPDWKKVADSLVAKYGGQLFIWNSSLNDVKAAVAAIHPTHVCFVCELISASPTFVIYLAWPFIRTLDSDPYCDAIWGIITGYNAQDALNLVTGSTGFDVKTALGGTSCCDLSYYTQGLRTFETTYNKYSLKYPDSLGISDFYTGPTDRTEWLIDMLNDGISFFNYDSVDIFYTSGHGNYNVWQLHYPTPDLEGFFRSVNGQVYGDPYSGANINLNSNHPRIYFGIGNCYIGQITNIHCMALSWIHTGGAYQYTGYVITEGGSSYQHGATKAYFYRVAREYTWAEAYFLANNALNFDIINSTPGTNPPDLNGSALYGDPGMQVKMSHEGVYKQPLFTSELTINPGTTRDTVTFKITMNRSGNPGFTSKWGERHPAIIFPFRANNISIVYTNAISVVVKDNFALLYTWHQGQPSLDSGVTRRVVFSCDPISTNIEPKNKGTLIPEFILNQNYPNPFNPTTTISYSLPKKCNTIIRIYNIRGQLIETLVNNIQQAGKHSVVWNAENISSGLYFYRIIAGDYIATKKCILLK